MLRAIRSFVDHVERASTVVGAALLALVVALAGTEIVARTLFGSSSMEIVDLSLQIAILMYFIGYPALLNGGRDIEMDYFFVRFPPSAQRAITIVTNIAIVGFFLLLLFKSIDLFRLGLRFRHAVFPVPNAITIVPIVLGSVLGLVVAIRRALDSLVEPSPVPSRDDQGNPRL